MLFGFGPTVPFVIGAACVWWLPHPQRMIALHFVALWGGAILLFLSGVRRGLSFRTEGGPTLAQIVMMLLLYCLGLAAVAALLVDAVLPALTILIAGFCAVFLLDPIAARRGEAPLYFAKLRRLQIPIILIALAASMVVAAQS